MTIRSDTGPFAIVPEWLLDTKVSDRAVRLYALLARYADKNGVATPKRKTLANRLGGRSLDTVDRALRELVGVEALLVEERYDVAGDRTTNEYVVLRSPPGVAATLRPPGRNPAATGSRNPAASKNESQLEREGGVFTGVKTPRRRRRADPIFNALCDFAQIDWRTLNRAEAGRVATAKRSIAESVVLGLLEQGTVETEDEAKEWISENAEAVVAEIERRGREYVKAWPTAERTATALATNWSRFARTSKELDADRARAERGARLRRRIEEQERS